MAGLPLFVAGFVLLLAAGLKVHSLVFHPLLPGSPLLSRPLEQAVCVFEFLLGLWLISGWQRSVARLLSVVTFTVFAASSGWLGWQGHATCGCFGQVQVHPWTSFGIGLTMLASLLVTRPDWSDWRRSTLIGGIAVLILLVGCLGLWAFGGSPWLLLADWRGESVVVSPTQTEVGPGPVGQTQHFLITVHNVSRRPVRILGGTTDCACLATSDLPVTIPPSGSAAIRVYFKRTGQSGLFRRGLWLYTDAPAQPFAVAWFAGRIVGS